LTLNVEVENLPPLTLADLEEARRRDIEHRFKRHRFVAALFAALFMPVFIGEGFFSYTDPLFISFVLVGLPLVFIGWKMFLRSQSHLRMIERLLSDA
jgi:hypothetical protein